MSDTYVSLRRVPAGLLVLGLTVAGVQVVSTRAAHAHWSSGTYTYKNGGPCTTANRVDPITVMFYGSATGVARHLPDDDPSAG